MQQLQAPNYTSTQFKEGKTNPTSQVSESWVDPVVGSFLKKTLQGRGIQPKLGVESTIGKLKELVKLKAGTGQLEDQCKQVEDAISQE